MTTRNLVRRPGRVLNDVVQLERRHEAARTSRPTIYDFPSSVACSPVQLAAFDREIGHLHHAVAVANHDIYGDPLPPGVMVQRRGGNDDEAVKVHAAALRGVQGGAKRLPYLDRIQSAFGAHDVSGVAAHVGGPATEACDDMGASAYATGAKVAFRAAPDLHTVAHEAAHVVQQRAGVSLKGGVGAVGDRYEQHADRVADLVVRGQSAEHVLDELAGTGRGAPAHHKHSVQRRVEEGRQGSGDGDPAGAVEKKVEGVVAGLEDVLERELSDQEMGQVRDGVESQPELSVPALVQQLVTILERDDVDSPLTQESRGEGDGAREDAGGEVAAVQRKVTRPPGQKKPPSQPQKKKGQKNQAAHKGKGQKPSAKKKQPPKQKATSRRDNMLAVVHALQAGHKTRDSLAKLKKVEQSLASAWKNSASTRARMAKAEAELTKKIQQQVYVQHILIAWNNWAQTFDECLQLATDLERLRSSAQGLVKEISKKTRANAQNVKRQLDAAKRSGGSIGTTASDIYSRVSNYATSVPTEAAALKDLEEIRQAFGPKLLEGKKKQVIKKLSTLGLKAWQANLQWATLAGVKLSEDKRKAYEGALAGARLAKLMAEVVHRTVNDALWSITHFITKLDPNHWAPYGALYDQIQAGAFSQVGAPEPNKVNLGGFEFNYRPANVFR